MCENERESERGGGERYSGEVLPHAISTVSVCAELEIWLQYLLLAVGGSGERIPYGHHPISVSTQQEPARSTRTSTDTDTLILNMTIKKRHTNTVRVVSDF